MNISMQPVDRVDILTLQPGLSGRNGKKSGCASITANSSFRRYPKYAFFGFYRLILSGSEVMVRRIPNNNPTFEFFREMMAENTESPALCILVVDDEANIRKTLSYCLATEEHTVIAVSNPTDAIEESKRRFFDLAFVDLKLGAEDGLELIPQLAAISPWTKIVVITAHASIESAVEAMRRGAVDYIAKPFTTSQVRLLTGRIGQIRKLESEIASLKEDARRMGPEDRLQSLNAGMQRLIETTKKAAPSEAIILLQGKSGTGKSVFARAIHQWSPRAAKPMAVMACPAVPADLLESELFGHARGAFTFHRNL